MSQNSKKELDDETIDYIQSRLKERYEYKKSRDYEAADEIRDELKDNYSVSIDDRTREWMVQVDEYTVLDSDRSTRISSSGRAPRPEYELVEEEEEEDTDDVFSTGDDEVEIIETTDGDVESGDISDLTVVQLKEKLREAGLPVSGKKSELIERIIEAED